MTESEQIQPDPEQIAKDQAEAECAEFQASMAYRLGLGEDLKQNPHMLTCARCRAFFGDLEAIVNCLIEVFPPEVEPPDTLWAKLQSQILGEDGAAEGGAALKDGETPIGGDLALEGGVA